MVGHTLGEVAELLGQALADDQNSGKGYGAIQVTGPLTRKNL